MAKFGRAHVTPLGAVVLALLLAGSAAVVVNGALAPDVRLSRCGGDDPGNRVMAAFEMSRARDFWTHFPNAARPAPELEVESPAYVVVFDGPTHVTGLSTRKGGSDGLTTQLLDGVVCVLLPPNDLSLSARIG